MPKSMIMKKKEFKFSTPLNLTHSLERLFQSWCQYCMDVPSVKNNNKMNWSEVRHLFQWINHERDEKEVLYILYVLPSSSSSSSSSFFSFFQYLQSTFNLQNKQIVMFENHNDRQWLVYVKSVRIGSRHY